MVNSVIGSGMFGANCYIINNDKNEAIIIDAPSGASTILRKLDDLGLTLKKILITHGHCDHIESIPEIVEKTGCEVYIHENDLSKLIDNDKNLFNFFNLTGYKGYDKAITLKDGDVIEFGNLEIKVIHTPGHSSGSVCYTCGDNMFSGDTLFANDIGRTDIPDSNHADMIKSLEKLANIEKDYNVYPGHGEKTSLFYEKSTNPHLLGDYYDTAF